MSNLDQSPEEVLVGDVNQEELSDKDRQFITRFNLKKEDLAYKSLAHEEPEAVN